MPDNLSKSEYIALQLVTAMISGKYQIQLPENEKVHNETINKIMEYYRKTVLIVEKALEHPTFQKSK